MVLYQFGWNDARIGRESGVSDDAIRVWRISRELRPNNPAGQNGNRNAVEPEALMRRVRRAVGRALPLDILDDVVGDMFAALLDGSLPLGEIEGQCRKFGNRVLGQFASKFGPRSLDEELGEGEGFRLIDSIQDDRSSSWLEEMGASVW
jgi:hypothetical protein